MSYDSNNLTTPDIKWLGVRPSDLDRYVFHATGEVKAGSDAATATSVNVATSNLFLSRMCITLKKITNPLYVF